MSQELESDGVRWLDGPWWRKMKGGDCVGERFVRGRTCDDLSDWRPQEWSDPTHVLFFFFAFLYFGLSWKVVFVRRWLIPIDDEFRCWVNSEYMPLMHFEINLLYPSTMDRDNRATRFNGIYVPIHNYI